MLRSIYSSTWALPNDIRHKTGNVCVVNAGCVITYRLLLTCCDAHVSSTVSETFTALLTIHAHAIQA